MNTDTARPVLRVSDLEMQYPGTDAPTLVGIDLDVPRGQFVSLVGPSGCGKTTLLKIFAGLVEPTGGTCDFDGTGRPPPFGAYGMVFQSHALLEWRTVLSNVLLPADVRGLPKQAARARARELLDLVMLPGVEDSYPSQLSGGMRQRVSIARSMLHDPDVLYMDEPFGALDAMTREEMISSLQRIHQAAGKSVVFVTHSISEAVMLSDRLIVMGVRPGRIVADVTIDLPRPRDLVVQHTPEFARIEGMIRDSIEHQHGGR